MTTFPGTDATADSNRTAVASPGSGAEGRHGDEATGEKGHSRDRRPRQPSVLESKAPASPGRVLYLWRYAALRSAVLLLAQGPQ